MVDQWSSATLRFVYPPISNQEAVWLEKEEDVAAVLRTSHFYAIGARREAFFSEFSADETVLSFTLSIGDEIYGRVSVDVDALPEIAPDTTVFFRLGTKIIQIWDTEPPLDPDEAVAHDGQVLYWWTTEKLIYDLSSAHEGFNCDFWDRVLDASTYDLLYIGIATEQDTYARLVAAGHKARMNILANESQRHRGSRPTDETYLFFFRVDAILGRSLGPNEEIPDDFFDMQVPITAIVRDAEKAYVSRVKPLYNEVLFKNYPRGADGLYSLGYDGYSYCVAENIRFITRHGSIRGHRINPGGETGDQADILVVRGDTVEVYREA